MMTSRPQQLLLPHRPLVLGVAGCSGSGKTTLARELTSQLDAVLLPPDVYYRDLSALAVEDRAKINFDHPDSLEIDLLIDQLNTLASGRAIDRPVYDFSTHTRLAGVTEHLAPASVILVEGILALHYPALRALFDLSVFVNAPHAVCLTRRIYRDVRERGRTEASVREQFAQTTQPMADRFVLPSAVHASVTVDGTDSLDWSIEAVLGQLQQAGLFRHPRPGHPRS